MVELFVKSHKYWSWPTVIPSPLEGKEICQGKGTVRTPPAAFERLPGVPETVSRSSGERFPALKAMG